MKFTVSFLCLVLGLLTDGGRVARAATVGPAGYTNAFAAQPAAADFSTLSIAGGAGGAGDSITPAQVETNIAALAAASITARPASSNANPPNATSAAVYSSAGGYLQTRATGNRISVLMATLFNGTGTNGVSVTVSYDFATNALSAEQVGGHSAFYSLTGTPGTWVNIPEFSQANTGRLSATLNISWNDSTPLYLIWADDNGSGAPDTACQIDNFSVRTDGGTPAPPSIAFTSPTNGQVVVQYSDLVIATTSGGHITNVYFIVDGSIVTNDTTTPYGATVNMGPYAPGNHTVEAIVEGALGSEFAGPITITIIDNAAPAIVITNLADGTNFLVGTAIPVQALVTDDAAGVTNIDWFVDGNLFVSRAAANCTYLDALAGTHTFQAVATDRGGLSTPSAIITINVTNPPAQFTLLVTNGSEWRYYGATAEPPVQGGTLVYSDYLYDDSTWASGFAELGGGDAVDGYPEKTLIDIGPAASRHRTIYFRRHFNVDDPSAFANLVVRLLRDDGGVVFINGAPVMTNNITVTALPVPYATLAAASDDGVAYQVLNISPSALAPGDNVVAVEIHQQSATSSDLSFDLMLWGEAATAPVVVITAPTNSQSFVEATNVAIAASVSTFVTNVEFRVDGATVAVDGATPFAGVWSNATPGLHSLTAVGYDLFGASVTSAPVLINVLPNQPPTVAITNVICRTTNSAEYLVGSALTNQMAMADDNGITNVAFLVNGVIRLERPNALGQIINNDTLAGTNIFQVVATDRSGVSVTSAPVVIVATNPAVNVLVPNGSVWKYDNSSNDLGTAWIDLNYADGAWAEGPGDLAQNGVAENTTERTRIDIGLTGARIPTIYFRHKFNLASTNGLTNLIVNLLRDDGAKVYLNGSPVFTNNIAAAAVFTTLATAAAGDDGTVYQRANVRPPNLVVGDNILAVEVHQSSLTSSDFTFDLMLWAEPAGALLPPLGISTDSVNVTLTWSGEAGFKLQQSPAIEPANWTDVPGNPALLVIPINTAPAYEFFRLTPAP